MVAVCGYYKPYGPGLQSYISLTVGRGALLHFKDKNHWLFQTNQTLIGYLSSLMVPQRVRKKNPNDIPQRIQLCVKQKYTVMVWTLFLFFLFYWLNFWLYTLDIFLYYSYLQQYILRVLQPIISRTGVTITVHVYRFMCVYFLSDNILWFNKGAESTKKNVDFFFLKKDSWHISCLSSFGGLSHLMSWWVWHWDAATAEQQSPEMALKVQRNIST